MTTLPYLLKIYLCQEMKTLNLLLFTISLLFVNSVIAQEECGTDEILRRNIFHLHNFESRVACAPEVDMDTAQVLTIPVVFHIVHLGEAVGEGTNISDEQILSSIENLNDRFRGDTAALSELTTQYDEYELSLVRDSKIEFCLASRDPDNNPTDGINRYDGSDLVYSSIFAGQQIYETYAEDGISTLPSSNPTGIPDAYFKQQYHWPEDKYFNVYVVTEINGNNGGGGIQGYSYLGSMGTGATGYQYGPVCLYNVVGTVGELKNGRTLNSTLTHEVGHAFNLYHTFGISNGNCEPESNPCTQGDQVADTPPTSTNYSCNSTNCPEAMTENYMDYSSETCKTTFTQGQIERMREEIWVGLPYLVSVNNTSCQSPNSKDVGITAVTTPSDWCLETLDFDVKINNFGGEDAEGVTLTVNGGTYNVPTIGAGEFVIISITDFVLNDGVIQCEAIYELDEFLGNNSFTQTVEITEQNWVEVIISPDVWSNEIDWEIIDESGEVVLSGGDYPVFSQDIDFIESSCLPDGCYTFIITDSNGDGMCAFDLEGDGICDSSYESFINIFVNNNLTFELSQPDEMDFGSILEVDFCTIYCPSENCDGDFNGDGIVTVRDLIELLATPMGELDDCSEFDLNNDLTIGVNDVLIFLNLMGYDCYTGEYYEPGMSPFGDNDVETIINSTNINKEIREVNYYSLRGVKVIYNHNISSGVYIRETIYSDGTREIMKVIGGQ